MSCTANKLLNLGSRSRGGADRSVEPALRPPKEWPRCFSCHPERSSSVMLNPSRVIPSEARNPSVGGAFAALSGESRFQVVEAIGAPTANVKNGDQSCDVYKVYTRGPGGVGRGVIAAGEAAADVVTLGLAEVVFTPLEAGTRNAKHTVTFCYDRDGKLLSLNDAPPE